MGFTDAIKTCFKKYAVVNGRAARSEFWYWTLFCLIAGFVLGLIEGIVVASSGSATPSNILSTIFSFATFIPGITVTARRLHDVNMRAWWMLIAITIVGIIPLIYWYCIRGTVGPNRFGDDPLVG